MKLNEKKPPSKGRARGGAQALAIGPQGVTEHDSPVINALRRKQQQSRSGRQSN